MNCGACAAPNRPEARFCRACGDPLQLTCPRCNRQLEAGARFCDHCGAPLDAGVVEREPRAYTPRHLSERILQQRSALEGERKLVTVLFADIKGSLELSQEVDMEEWHRILDDFFSLLSAGVHRFEGTINQYTGDGIMALFGAPVAHEDHARRACFAALHLADELRSYADDLRRTRGLNASVRIGLNSGEVVVGRIGDDLRMDYTAQGPVVGLSQRMEELAEPGKCFLTEHTAELVRGYVELRALGDFSIRGMEDPVGVYELVGPGPLSTRLERAREHGFSRFVGREADMARLDLALAEARRGIGQVVGAVADPGIGKSRLFHEFAQRIRAHGTQVLEAHCVSHGARIPFLPVLELLRGIFGISEGDADDEARRKIAGTVVLLNPEFERSLPLLFEFLGVPDSRHDGVNLTPELRRERLFRLLERVLLAGSRDEPAVIVLEDLHWIDPGTEAFLEHLVASVPGTRTLLLLNFRPEYKPPWTDAPHYTQSELHPLGPELARELALDWLGPDPGLSELTDRILATTAGNPFFIEELLRALVDSGELIGERGAVRLARPDAQIAIPDSVHTVLAGRIDRLDERRKQILQTAAVVGKHFSAEILARVLQRPEDALADALSSLVDANFLAEVSLFPKAEYAFSHPLTREVAYRAQLFHQRADLHRQVAEAIIESAATGLDERAALLAHHYEGAGLALDAARWHRRAAHWVGLSDPGEAMRHWRSVAGLLSHLSDDPEVRRLRLEAVTERLNLGWRFGLSEAESSQLHDEGRVLAESLQNPALLARLLMAYGQVVSWTAATDGRESFELGHEAVLLADQTDDESLQAAARGQLSRAYWRARDYRRALEATEESLRRAPQSNEHLRFRARVLSEMGRLEDARGDLDRALEVARVHRDVSERTLTHLCFGIYARFVGDFALERVHAQSALDLAERTGDVFGCIQSTLALGESYLWEQSFEQAIELLQAALGLARERHANLFAEASMLGLLADAYLGAGERERALATAEEAVSVRGAPSIQALQALARCLLAGGSREEQGRAESVLEQADAFIEHSGARSWEPHILVTRAALARLRGNEPERERELGRAISLLQEMGATGHAAQVALTRS